MAAVCWRSLLIASCSVKPVRPICIRCICTQSHYKPSLSKKPWSRSRHRVSTVSNKRLNSKWPRWQNFTGGVIHLEEMEFRYSSGTSEREMIIGEFFFLFGRIQHSFKKERNITFIYKPSRDYFERKKLLATESDTCACLFCTAIYVTARLEFNIKPSRSSQRSAVKTEEAL